MSRPSSGIDLKLIRAGSRLVREKGLYGLGVRAACRAAGVNTGMFHYYFKSKNEFSNAVLKNLYGEFMVHFRAAIEGESRADLKLRAALVALAKFARASRRVLPSLLADVVLGNKAAFLFVRGNFTEHIGLITGLIKDWQRESAAKTYHLETIISVLVPPMIFPALALSALEKNGVKTAFGRPLAKMEDAMFSDAAIKEKADLLMEVFTRGEK
jgi:AcrR family transcriptional regulator